MNYELHKVCRICLKSDLLVSIYSPTFLLRPIEMIEKLNIFTADDSLPTLLCQSCLYRLLDAFNLKQLAESSEHRLRDYLATTSTAGSAAAMAGPACALVNVNSIQQLDTLKDINDPSGAMMYANICDIFDPNVQSNDIEVEAADIEIDVSSLTRSEAEDTLSEVFVSDNTHLTYRHNPHDIVEDAGEPDNHDLATTFTHQMAKDDGSQVQETLPAAASKRAKRSRIKVLKIPDKCLECGKVFNYSGYLEAHKRTHTGEKPFKCKFCLRQFRQSSNLLLHQRTHTGERRFQCEICSNFFTTSSNLKAHRLTHLEFREFQCNRCERNFKTSRELQRHTSIHKAIKDIVCEVCQKAFAKQCYLSAHMATVHRGVRRHKCNECGKVFSSRSNLVCHMRTHTGEKPFQCKYCTWKFNQSSALVRHMKKHTKTEAGRDVAAPTKTTTTTVQTEDPVIYSSLINNLLHDSELPAMDNGEHHPNHNYSALPSLPSEVHLNATEAPSLIPTATAALQQAYDFTKDAILDFSTNQQQNHQTTTELY